MINNLDHVVVTYNDNVKTAGIVDQYVPCVYLELLDLFGHRKHIPVASIKTIDIVGPPLEEMDLDDGDGGGGDDDDDDDEDPPSPWVKGAIFWMNEDDIA